MIQITKTTNIPKVCCYLPVFDIPKHSGYNYILLTLICECYVKVSHKMYVLYDIMELFLQICTQFSLEF